MYKKNPVDFILMGFYLFSTGFYGVKLNLTLCIDGLKYKKCKKNVVRCDFGVGCIEKNIIFTPRNFK